MSLIRSQIRSVLTLALPLILAEVGWMFMAVVDTVMVGHLPHPAITISAVALAQVLYNTLAFGIGGDTLRPRHLPLAVPRRRQVRRGQSLASPRSLLAAILSAVLMSVVHAASFALFHMPVEPCHPLDQAVTFLRVLNTRHACL
jgi:MATE family multidrug resistance protein